MRAEEQENHNDKLFTDINGTKDVRSEERNSDNKNNSII